MANKNLYSVLGIDKNATEADIKKAYRKSALKWHPDKWGNSSKEEQKKAEENFKAATEAYEILSDKDKKSQYDLFGTTDFSGASSNASGMNTDDIFREFMRSTGFGNFGGFNHHNERRSYRGTDKKIRIGVTIEDVYFRRLKTVTYEVERPCDECDGKGTHSSGDTTCPYCNGSGFITQTQSFRGAFMQQTAPCPHCHGSGTVVKDPCHKCGGSGVVLEKVEKSFKVPPIDRLSYTYKMECEGNACHNAKGPDGDLYFTFALVDDKNNPYHINEEKPYDIFTTLDVDVFQCICGGKKKVTLIDGSTVDLVIPQGTKDGQEFRIKGKGFNMTFEHRGDFVMKVNMVMRKLNDKQIELINKEFLENKR